MKKSVTASVTALVLMLCTARQGLAMGSGLGFGRGNMRSEAMSTSNGSNTFTDQQCMGGDEFQQAVDRFSRFLQFRTVSSPSAPHHVVEPGEFAALHTWLPGAYPEVWEAMEVEQVGCHNYSLLLRWPGAEDPSPSPSPSPAPTAPPPPVLLYSHLDVVPVANETLGNWTHPPFSGAVEGGYIWGRGTLDVNVGVAGMLEAATLLLRQGWRPRRTLYFAFGQDEEVGGELGAGRITQLLAERGVEVDMVYDEGPSIGADGYPPYMSYPMALVGTAEKGYVTILADITTSGGHSSLPPLDGSSAASVAARLIAATDRRPPPVALREPVPQLLAALAPYTPGVRGALFRLAGAVPGLGWLVAEAYLARDTPETAALVRNTVAVTGLTSGFAENVLPPGASVRVNSRLLPGATPEDVVSYLKEAAGRDLPHVSFRVNGGQNASSASPVTPVSSPYFAMLRDAVQAVYKLADGRGAAVVAPTLMPGGTDSKHFLAISRFGALRHTPVSLNKTAGDVRRVHGLNERVSVQDFGRCICTYLELVTRLGQQQQQQS